MSYATLIDSIFQEWISQGPNAGTATISAAREGLVSYHDKLTSLYKKSGEELATMLQSYMIFDQRLAGMTPEEWGAAIEELRA